MSDAEQQRHEQNVAAGLKASISNPRISDEAKERAAERLEEMGVAEEAANSKPRTRSSDTTEETDIQDNEDDSHEDEVHMHRVIGGYKATVKNPNVSDEAKENARRVLKASGEDYDE